MSAREKWPEMYEMKICPRCDELKSIRKTGKFCSVACARRNQDGRTANRIHLAGERHPQWKGDAAGYEALHDRVRNQRGKASEQACKCGAPAKHWACLGDYVNVDDYEAMCVPCHKRHDLDRIAEERRRAS